MLSKTVQRCYQKVCIISPVDAKKPVGLVCHVRCDPVDSYVMCNVTPVDSYVMCDVPPLVDSYVMQKPVDRLLFKKTKSTGEMMHSF